VGSSASASVKRIVAHPKLVNAEKQTNSAHNIVIKEKDLTYFAKIAPQKMKENCDAKVVGSIPFSMQHFLYLVKRTMNFTLQILYVM
jgi:hypothetical protein